MTDLSIVIVNFDTRALVLECLASVEREMSRPDGVLRFEIFVVDNGSTDGSADAVRAAFPGVVVLALPENRGFARGNNAALAQTKGQVVLLLNSDVVLEPGAIATALAALRNDPLAGAAGIQLLHPDGRLQNSIHRFPGLLGELTPTWLFEVVAPRRYPSKRRPAREPIAVDAVLGAALFVKREVIDRIGGLPDAYFFFFEETEWCLQMKRAGYRVLHVPGARAIHRSGASSKRVDPIATRIEYHRSLYLFLQRNRGTSTAVSVVCVRFAKHLLSLVPLVVLGSVSPRHRARRKSVARLLHWHFRGRPADWGLARDRAN